MVLSLDVYAKMAQFVRIFDFNAVGRLGPAEVHVLCTQTALGYATLCDARLDMSSLDIDAFKAKETLTLSSIGFSSNYLTLVR